MCNILNTSYINGKFIVEVSSTTELVNYTYELYLFDFKNGCYKAEPNVSQPISSLQASRDGGVYTFKYDIPANCKVKCAVTKDGNVVASRECVVGSRHKIKVAMENSPIGYLYKLKADVSISKKLIFYKSKVSSTKINIPADIEAGETLVFTIKDKDFKPHFETYPEYAECITFENC